MVLSTFILLVLMLMLRPLLSCFGCDEFLAMREMNTNQPTIRLNNEKLGRRIFHYIKTRNIRGETGQVAFDDNGDRMFAEYEVINVRDHQRKKIVGKLLYDTVCRNLFILIFVSMFCMPDSSKCGWFCLFLCYWSCCCCAVTEHMY